MMRVRQMFWVLCVALSLVLQGQSAAAQVTMRDAAGQIVICTGAGPMTVYVDAEGEPTSPPEHCPDCLMVSVVALLAGEVDLPAPEGSTKEHSKRIAGFLPDWLTQAPCARAPPGVADTLILT